VSNISTTLPIQQACLPVSTLEANNIPSLSESLVSIGNFCDQDCIAVFDNDKVHVLRGLQTEAWLSTLPQDEIILLGDRDSTDSLWNLPLHKQICNNALRAPTAIAQRVAYYHACLRLPTMSTWCEAIDAGHLSSFPSLTSAQVRKHYPQSLVTYMGHLDQSRQGQGSTKVRPYYSRDLYLGIFDTKSAAPSVPHRPGTIYSDQTEKFILVYDADSNYIFAETLPSRTTHQLVTAYDKIQVLLISRGITPYLHILDNDVSTLFKA
jgi:hypothetical protein